MKGIGAFGVKAFEIPANMENMFWYKWGKELFQLTVYN